MSRGEPTVDEIVPADALPTVAFGRSNCGWFSVLKNSPRICRRYRSFIGTSLKMDASRFVLWGPRRMLRPPFPYVYCKGVAHAAPGVLNEVSNHLVMVGSETCLLVRWFGRLPPAFDTEVASTGVKGRP